MKNENFETCRQIADDLYKIAKGSAFRCPECGEIITEENTTYDEIHDVMTCPHCSAEFNSDDVDPFGILDYFTGALDIEYHSRGRGADDYAGVRIMVAFGGPNIYVDTKRGCVELFWWNEYARCDLWNETRYAIDEIFEEFWRCY